MFTCGALCKTPLSFREEDKGNWFIDKYEANLIYHCPKWGCHELLLVPTWAEPRKPFASIDIWFAEGGVEEIPPSRMKRVVRQDCKGEEILALKPLTRWTMLHPFHLQIVHIGPLLRLTDLPATHPLLRRAHRRVEDKWRRARLELDNRELTTRQREALAWCEILLARKLGLLNRES